jgi:hypothetical protein
MRVYRVEFAITLILHVSWTSDLEYLLAREGKRESDFVLGHFF